MSKKNKEPDKTTRIDLKKPVEDVYGDPLPDRGGYTRFDRPTTLQDEAGRKFEKVTQLFHNAEELTYQKAIIAALQHNPPPQADVPDVAERSFLAIRLAGTTKAEFTGTEINVITKCAKAFYGQPEQPAIIYARIVQLVDPVEAKKHLNLE